MATNSVVSAIRVLETVAERQPIGLSELAREVGLPKSTVQRCLLTLQDVGWCRSSSQQPTRWSLTYRAFSVGNSAGGTGSLRELALPLLSELQIRTGETIHLAAPDERELVLLERVDTAHRLRAFLPLGERIVMHASATGQAFLAASPDDDVTSYLDGGLTARTPYTVTDPDELLRTLAAVRERGYSINVEGLSVGITALGAAVTVGGRPVGAISVSGPTSRMTPDTFDEHGRAVQEAAHRISAEVTASGRTVGER